MRWKVQDKKNIKSRIQTVFCLFPRRIKDKVYWLESIQVYQEKVRNEDWCDAGSCTVYYTWEDKYIIEEAIIEPEWKSQN